MTKKLDKSIVANELKAGSAFFPGFQQSKQRHANQPTPLQPESETTEAPNNASDDQSGPRPAVTADAHTSARTPVRRHITRYAFEFYQDQIATLQRWALEEKLVGEKGSMSEMVRQALDQYIEERAQYSVGRPQSHPSVRANGGTELRRNRTKTHERSRARHY